MSNVICDDQAIELEWPGFELSLRQLCFIHNYINNKSLAHIVY